MRIGRLSLKIYAYGVLAVYAPILVFVAAILSFKSAHLSELTFVSERLVMDLWRHRDDPDRLRTEVARVSELPVRVTLYDSEGRLIVSTATPPFPMLAEPQLHQLEAARHMGSPHGVTAYPIQENGRVVGVAMASLHAPFLYRHVWLFVVLLLGLKGASVAFARHIARPLQQLASTTEKFGHGELSARARLERKDEIGDLARAFDGMADRVTSLMSAQQELLVNVSHELLTPLSRIQVAVDLI